MQFLSCSSKHCKFEIPAAFSGRPHLNVSLSGIAVQIRFLMFTCISEVFVHALIRLRIRSHTYTNTYTCNIVTAAQYLVSDIFGAKVIH